MSCALEFVVACFFCVFLLCLRVFNVFVFWFAMFCCVPVVSLRFVLLVFVLFAVMFVFVLFIDRSFVCVVSFVFVLFCCCCCLSAFCVLFVCYRCLPVSSVLV